MAQGSRLASPYTQAEQGRGAVGVAGRVDGEDADRVPAGREHVGPGRDAGSVGLAVELAAEGRTALVGGEAEDGPGAGLARGQDGAGTGADLGPGRGAVAGRLCARPPVPVPAGSASREVGSSAGISSAAPSRTASQFDRHVAVADRGEVDDRPVDVGAAVDRAVGVAGSIARVGEDRVGARPGRVGVGAFVAEQLVGAGVAVRGRRRGCSPRDPRFPAACRSRRPRTGGRRRRSRRTPGPGRSRALAPTPS